jgi:predicted AAA+ superfamily ATPase
MRHIYLQVARQTGQEISQISLAESANAAGYRTNQPTVGKYLHFLADALLVREFRRYPLSPRASARVPAKVTLTDLGVRNAILRGAPSLWESPLDVVGPLVETLAQAVIRDSNLQTHYFRDYEDSKNRRSDGSGLRGGGDGRHGASDRGEIPEDRRRRGHPGAAPLHSQIQVALRGAGDTG